MTYRISTAAHIYQIRKELRTKIIRLAAQVERNAMLAFCRPATTDGKPDERAISYRRGAEAMAGEAMEVAQRLARYNAQAEAEAWPGTKAGRAKAEARAMRTDQLAESRDFRRAR